MQEMTLAKQEYEVEQNELKLPVILKGKTLLTPGKWNGLNFTANSIKEGFELTDWSDKKNYALIYEHEERATNWLGNVLNLEVTDSGELVGDLEIWDKDLALKLVKGGAKLGVSARVLGVEDDDGNFNIKKFANFSVVYDPACKNAYINLSEKLKEEKTMRVKPMELSVTSSGGVSGESIGGETNEKKYWEKKKKKKKEDMEDESESTEMKGGQDLTEKMEDEKKDEVIEQPSEESKEEPKEETVENSEEESKEETTEESGKESEDKSEELSSKLNLVIKELKSLGEKIAKLSESQEEPKEEKKEEESSENLSKKKDVKSMSVVDNTVKIPKGYSKGDAEFAEMLLSQAKLR